MDYKVEYVRGHLEVYSASGAFLFSADDMQDVRCTLKEIYA